MSKAAQRRLPVLAILRDAFALPWRHRAEVFRATGLPMLVLIAVSLFWDLVSWRLSLSFQWLSQFVYVFVFGWLATAVHRLVLLDAASASDHFRLRSWRRVGVYFLAFAFIVVLFHAVKFGLFNGIGLATGINYVPAGEQPNVTARRWLDWSTTLIAWLAIMRVILVLPSIAVDHGHEMKKAWRLSRGHSWGLLLLIAVFPWALDWCRWLLYRDGATALEHGLIHVLACVCAVIEVIALSLSYGALKGPVPPSTDPPA